MLFVIIIKYMNLITRVIVAYSRTILQILTAALLADLTQTPINVTPTHLRL